MFLCVQLKSLSAEVLDLEMLFSTDVTPDPHPSGGPTAVAAAPVVTYQPNSVEYYNIPVPIDVICMLSLTTPFQSVYDLVSEGISSQLEQIQKYVLYQTTHSYYAPEYCCKFKSLYSLKQIANRSKIPLIG